MTNQPLDENILFQLFFEQSSQLLCLTNNKGVMVKTNSQWHNKLGYSSQELANHSIFNLVHINDQQTILQFFNQVETKKHSKLIRVRLLHANGQIIYVDWEIIAGPLFFSTIQIIEQPVDQGFDKFKYSIDKAMDGIIWINRQGGFDYANEQAYKSLGYTKEEFLQLTLFDIDPAYSRDQFENEWQSYLQNKTENTFYIKTIHKRKDGTTLPVEIQARHYWINNQELHVAHIHDLTKEHQANLEFEELALLNQAILDGVSLGLIFIKNRKIQWVNNALLDMFGYQYHELMGESAKIFYGDEWMYDKIGAEVYPVLARGESFFIEIKGKKKDGTLFWCLLTSKASDPSDLSKGSLWIVTDIDQRKHYEETLEKNQRILVDSQRLAHMGSWELDLKTNKLIWNQEAFLLYGYQPNEIEPTLDLFYKLVHPEDLDRVKRHLQEIIQTKVINDLECRIIRPNNEIRNFIIVGEFLLDTEGGVNKLYGIIQDVTKSKQNEDALRKRVIALTRPLDDIRDIEFTDLFNLDELQTLQDAFAKATGVASIITYPNGTPITKPSNFCKLCKMIRSTDKGRVQCQLSDSHIGKQNINGPTLQPCLSGGLWDAGASITLGGIHVANWLIGQIRNSTVNEKYVINYAKDLGLDQTQVLEAYKEIPQVSDERFQYISNALFLLANEISLKSYQNLQQARLISEQKESEKLILEAKEKAEESEHRFKALHNASFGGIAIHDHGIIMDCNLGLSEMTGYSVDELIGMDGLNLVAIESRTLVMQNITNQYEKPYEAFGLRKNKTTYPLRIEARNIPYKGKTVRAVEFRDMTWVKETEQKLIQAKIKAEESEYFLQESQKAGHIGSYKMNFKTGEWMSTPTLDRIYGIDDSYPRNGHSLFMIIHPDDQNKVQVEFKQSILSGNTIEAEYRIIRPDTKEVRWVHSNSKAYFNENNELTELLGTIQDITDRKQIEEERKQMNIELEQRVKERTLQLKQANSDLEAFAYSVSHDLRAPIRHINGFLNLLKTSIQEWSPKSNDYFNKIEASSLNMTVMIDELLEFSRLGRADLKVSTVNMDQVISKVLEQLKPDYINRKINWQIKPISKVKGDSALLKIAFENLISNAIKYSAKKEVAIIEIGECNTENTDQVCIYVKDNGAGFDMTYKNKLFGVFQRLHRSEDFEGVGIGLANVKQIIHKHGGSIDAESVISESATFFVTLNKSDE